MTRLPEHDSAASEAKARWNPLPFINKRSELSIKSGPPNALIDEISYMEGYRKPGRKLDAVIVPTSYVPTGLEESVKVSQIARSKDVSPPVVYLCSGDATPRNVLDFLTAKGANTTDTLAIQLPQDYIIPGLQLETDTFPVPGYTKRDLATKRNLGLALARMMDWEHILFLDDDITGFDQQHINLALNGFDKERRRVVAWKYTDDQSIMKLARRRAIGGIEPFISGGASIVRVDDETTFFPDIYNEDWLFFASNMRENPHAIARAGTLNQQPKDLFRDSAAAEQEAVKQEFGDTLAEGLLYSMSNNISIRPAGTAFWRNVLELRETIIYNLIDRLNLNNSSDPNYNIRSALNAAVASHDGAWLDLLPKYTQIWLDDYPKWQSWYKELPKGIPLHEAIEHLDIVPVLAKS